MLFGWVVKRPLPDAVAQAYLAPLRKSAGVRRDLRKLLRDVHPRHTLAAAEALRTFDRPVLLAWAPRTSCSRSGWPTGSPRCCRTRSSSEIADSYAFVSEDQPAALAGHIVEFAGVMAD